MPGAGKTVMTAVVVDHLRSKFQGDPAVGIACIYCSIQNEAEQTPSGIFLSLLRQLIKQLSYTPEIVKSMYDRHTRAGDRPSFLDISDALLDTISRFQRTFIVVDALDELLTSESPPKQLVKEIFALQEKSGINIFATSRYVPEIAGEFKQSIQIDVRAAEDDVARFLDSHIGELPAFVSDTPGLEDEIKTGIITAIDGMLVYHA
jgi:Cdc6-like AAA superfamily ATPase